MDNNWSICYSIYLSNIKMVEKYNLSEKRTISFNGNLEKEEEYCYEEIYIKEFIEKVKKKLKGYCHCITCENRLKKEIDKLAGTSLFK